MPFSKERTSFENACRSVNSSTYSSKLLKTAHWVLESIKCIPLVTTPPATIKRRGLLFTNGQSSIRLSLMSQILREGYITEQLKIVLISRQIQAFTKKVGKWKTFEEFQKIIFIDKGGTNTRVHVRCFKRKRSVNTFLRMFQELRKLMYLLQKLKFVPF